MLLSKLFSTGSTNTTSRQLITIRRVLVVCIGLTLHNQAGFAQHEIPWYQSVYNNDFSNAPGADILLGDEAKWLDSEGFIQLTPSEQGKAGRCFIRTPCPLATFDMRFDAWFGGRANNGGGADGIVAAFAARFNYQSSFGGELNFTGSGGYGLEFDTYRNTELNDPSEEHMALIQSSTSNHLHSELFTGNELEDEEWHSVRITNANGLIKMWFDGVSRFEYQIQDFKMTTGYFGFCAATATSFNEHRIDNVQITVPARTSTSFGNVTACLPFSADTIILIRNNHPDGNSIQIDSISIQKIAGTGQWVVSTQQLPINLQDNEFLEIELRYTTSSTGTQKALVRAYAANGEVLVDTTSITLSTPQLMWSTQALTFPTTHVKAYTEELLYLINTGNVAAEVDGIRTSWSEFTVLSPASFPITIGPGDSLEVRLRFSPESVGGQNALVQLDDFCGIVDDLLLVGAGYSSYVDFAFDHNLMLHPYESGETAVLLESNGSTIPLKEFSFHISYDTKVARFDKLSRLNSIVPGLATIETAEDVPGFVHVYIYSEQPITGPGAMFRLQFTDITYDFACGPMAIDTVILNQSSTAPGVPFTSGDSSSVCINASCRVPEGIHRVLEPTISVAPNPARGAASVHIESYADAMWEVTISNEAGMTVGSIFNGFLAKGPHVLPFEHNEYASGKYFVVMRSEKYNKSVLVIIP